MKSHEWLAAQSDAQQLYIQLKNDAELGVLAGPDMSILEKMSGGDPTQMRDPSAALRQLRANMVNNLNSDIKASTAPGQTPKRYEPAKVERAQATERTAVQNQQVWDAELLKNESVDPATRARAAQRAVDSADALSRQYDPYMLKVMASDARNRRDAKVFTDDQYEKVMKSIRREWRKKIDDYDSETRRKMGARGDILGAVVKPAFTDAERNAAVDEAIFARVGD